MFPRIFLFYILLMVLMLLSYEVFSQKNPENLVTDTLKDKKQSGLIKRLIDLVSKGTFPKEKLIRKSLLFQTFWLSGVLF